MFIFLLLLPVLSPSIQLFLPKPKINFWHISHIITCNQSPSPVYSHSLIPSLLPKSKTQSSPSEYWNGFLTFFQLHSFIPLIHFPHGKPECSFKNINQIIWVSQLLLCYAAVISNPKFQWLATTKVHFCSYDMSRASQLLLWFTSFFFFLL